MLQARLPALDERLVLGARQQIVLTNHAVFPSVGGTLREC